MAIEFINNLSNPIFVKQNQNHSNRFQDEVNRKAGDAKISQEQLLKASEKINNEPSNTSSYRFQEMMPVTNTLKTIRVFNEVKKPNSVSSSSLAKTREASETEHEEISTEPKTELIGKGFYVVSGNAFSQKGKLLQPANEDVIREQLKEFYISETKRKSGNLVNLTF
ncbi:MAG: hypothetical protein FD143_1728 [Ignavibacteria bacterium]|nr:MAG: hypothetical protein FD143_1728 [Ignavibacteria bacterium]KAF0160076.1 MAG: hypothetical protein FD188_1890 [Ignavibacteria bacterium]